MTRASFDAKAAPAGCAIYRRPLVDSAGSDKSRPISERMQAPETRIPAFRRQALFTRFERVCVPFRLEDFASRETNRKLRRSKVEPTQTWPGKLLAG